VESVLHTLDNQYSKFIKLFGKMPDHIDVHQGLPQNRKIVFAYQVFVSRHKLLSRFDNTHNMIYDFYGQKKFRDTTSDIQVKYLKQILNSLPGNKPNLLVCHPGFSNRNLKDPYNYERRIEVDTLTSSEILSLINSKSIIVEAFNSLTTFRKVNP
jgi:hypothetical protein